MLTYIKKKQLEKERKKTIAFELLLLLQFIHQAFELLHSHTKLHIKSPLFYNMAHIGTKLTTLVKQ